MISKSILFFLFLSLDIFAQWEFGASFNYKNEIPKTGIGITVSRNLPVQLASFGIKSRIGFDYFFNNETGNNFNADLHADIFAVLFYTDVYPYFGLSLGGSKYSINDFDEYIFFLGSFAGIKFLPAGKIQPFIEISSGKYFSSFNEQEAKEKITSVQFTGKIGLIIRF